MLVIGLELQLISLEFIIQYLKAYVILVYVLRSTPDRIAPPQPPHTSLTYLSPIEIFMFQIYYL